MGRRAEFVCVVVELPPDIVVRTRDRDVLDICGGDIPVQYI